MIKSGTNRPDPSVPEENAMNEDVAKIRVEGKYSVFTFRNHCIRFRTSPKLKKYLRVKEWNNGYLVVDVHYSSLGETEEYVDIRSILDDLYIDQQSFLSPIKEVQIENV